MHALVRGVFDLPKKRRLRRLAVAATFAAALTATAGSATASPATIGPSTAGASAWRDGVALAPRGAETPRRLPARPWPRFAARGGGAPGVRLGWQPNPAGAVATPSATTQVFASTAAGPISSDEFNSPTLNSSLWTFVNPLGDATVTMSGTQAQIGLPAGTRHDLWTGVDEVPRLVQTVPNVDFEVEVKFDSPVTAGYQMEGLLVEQDAANLLRLEVHHDGGAAHLFVAGVAAGVASTIHYSDVPGGAPIYLRLRRSDTFWTLSYSNNGTSWTSAPTFVWALTMTRIGPFGGNSGGSPPAFRADVDYFREITPAPPAADTTPPVISDVAVSPSPIGAVVTWSTDEAASSRVDYGATASYGSTVSDNALGTSHQLTLSGLSCATTYHYEVRSTDGSGNAAGSGDRTFTTSACPSSLTSDEFNAASIDTSRWTYVDPVGDTSVSANGSHAVISLPAGSQHDLWTGVDRLPRLVQATPDENFEVEVKYDSAVTAGYQMQGLLVQQDAGNMLRLEVHNDGGGTRLFVAGLSGGTAGTIHYSNVAGGAPVYLRLKRAGSTWTFSYSNNGSAWTSTVFDRSLAVRSVGVFAGNSGGSPPAFQASVDYFRYIAPDVTPPQISGITATAGPIAARIAWTTNEPAGSRVDYGLTTAYGSTATRAGLRTAHEVAVTALSCATTYHYVVRSTDGSGSEATSGDRTFTTAACPSSLVSDEFNSPTLDYTRWAYVDPVGDTSLSMSGTQAVMSLPAGSRHDLWTGADEVPRLLQATPDADFDIEVKFDTPVTARYQLEGILVQQDAANLLRLEVHNDGDGTRLFLAGVTGGTASTIHFSTVTGGSAVYLRLKRKGSTWTFRYSSDGQSWTSTSFTRAMTVRAVGPFAGNSGNDPPALEARVDYFRYFPPDVTPPQISGIAVTPAAISAEIAWTTNEPATSTVAHGPTSAYENGTVQGPGEVQSHRVQLHGLRCATVYHYQVRSVDSEGNAGASADRTFTTAACPAGLTSDEFNTTDLNTGLWSFFNPLGDATASANGSQAAIAVPAGTTHDVWTSSDTVPRLLQAAPDANLEVEAKFDAVVGTRYQQQGIIVEQDANNLLRFEIHFEGTETRFFVASISRQGSTVRYDARVAGGGPTYLRVQRTGQTWTARYSNDGETWPAVARFDQAFSPSAIGPFAGNAGGSPPAFTALVDYFRVVPPPPPDLTPPALTSVAALTHRTSAIITWSTSELASSRVEWGATSAYGQPVVAAGDLTAHRAHLTGLACATTYHYRVRSTDSAGNETVSSDRIFTTQPCAAGPHIAVWRGSPQTFGTVGVPQRWVNILGNVEDPQGIGSLSYRLNAGPASMLSIGPSDDRLAYAGDFNIELAHTELRPGANDVEITAVDSPGNVTVTHVTVDWQGNTTTQPPANGPVLVVAAHQDDEALGFAGVIDHARAAGRRIYVALVTNGDSGLTGSESGYCGAASGNPATNVAYGLRRSRETTTAMGLLGLTWTPNVATTELIFLGYPQSGLEDVAASTGAPWDGAASGFTRTYGEDFDGSNATCNGELRYLVSGRHSDLTAGSLAADLELLLDVARPADIYTHAGFDGNSDHAKTWSSLTAAIGRKQIAVRVHTTLIHPEGSGFCQVHSAGIWPNPALRDVNNNPFARFTPLAAFTAPPTPACTDDTSGSSWGPEGPPNENVPVPPAMQAPTEAENLKWQVISRYASQIDCSAPDYHVNCGYMRAFVKNHEFFWTRLYSPVKPWPIPYSASWTSTASIPQLAQIFEGQWIFDGAGIRPVSTGFDRVITLGDMSWTNYEVTAEMTFNSFDTSRPTVGAAAGLAVGWQGHSDWGQPRFGHPSGGLCLYAYNAADPFLYRLQLGYSPGPAHDTIVDWRYDDVALGVPYMMRFRERDLGNGSTRYSCKLWRSGTPEPSVWSVEADIPHWEGETRTHPGSIVLVAHHADVTFGDVTVTPAG